MFFNSCICLYHTGRKDSAVSLCNEEDPFAVFSVYCCHFTIFHHLKKWFRQPEFLLPHIKKIYPAILLIWGKRTSMDRHSCLW
ncbi:hypothetical protein CBFG_04203 [Clostridiales bacterium 1_7_47FAA]|nr:hypothetical protein CBFG_04203 [Clostridiales bacterium 1_7_47FAA]